MPAPGEVPVRNREVLVRNREVPVRNREVPVGNREVPVGNREVPVRNREGPVWNREVPGCTRSTFVYMTNFPANARWCVGREGEILPRMRKELVMNRRVLLTAASALLLALMNVPSASAIPA